MKQYAVPSDMELAAFRAACAAVAGPDATAWPGRYNPIWGGPLHNHCLAVACAVQARWGGQIVNGRVGGDACSHWWNLLPDGRTVDLTSEQFGGDGLHLPDGAEAWAVSAPPLVRWARHEAHVARFLRRLRAATEQEGRAA